MRSVIKGKTWEGRCWLGRGAKNQRQERIRSWQTAVSITHTSALVKADFVRTCEYIHVQLLQLAQSNIVKTSDLSRKKISGKWGGSEILDWWDYRRNPISFHFVCSFLSVRGSRPNSCWLSGTDLLTGIPREIPTGVPWESRRVLAKIPAYTPEVDNIEELVFFCLITNHFILSQIDEDGTIEQSFSTRNWVLSLSVITECFYWGSPLSVITECHHWV